MKHARGFTLIEILVVVSVIGLLIAILLPTLNKVRTEARRTSCASQLHQVALAMVAYTQENRDRMPYASFMPSIGPAPLETDTPIYFADVLARNLMGQKDVFSCPED